jgi:hypothetical protein
VRTPNEVETRLPQYVNDLAERWLRSTFCVWAPTQLSQNRYDKYSEGPGKLFFQPWFRED